jgi:Flp pilus assembly CpaF family ATPase
MFLRYASIFESQPKVAKLTGKSLKIGAEPSNDIVISGPYIDPVAIEIHRSESVWEVQAIGPNGCEVDGKFVPSGEKSVCSRPPVIKVFPYSFHFDSHFQEQRSEPEQAASLMAQEVIRKTHIELLSHLDLETETSHEPKNLDDLLKVERLIEAVAKKIGVVTGAYRATQVHLAGECVRDELLNKVIVGGSTNASIRGEKVDFWMQMATSLPNREEEMNKIVGYFYRALFSAAEVDVLERISIVEDKFWGLWRTQNQRILDDTRLYLTLRQIKKQVKDILYGFGPLEDLLRMPTVTEIMVNSSDEIFIEKDGLLQNSGRQFLSEDITTSIIERIVATVGRRIDTAQPMVDARLRDGSRVNAVIRPLATKGPSLTIRKFSRREFSLDRLIKGRSLSESAGEFLKAAVKARKSILVSGGTGSGKTTLLNCLGLEIPSTERIVTVEDTRELQLNHPNVVNLEARDSNTEGVGRVAISDLVRNSLRMRPSRIVVGECRGSEALDMLQAMNTGHDGSMTTIHANSANDALNRLEVLVRESGIQADTIRKQIGSAFDLIVQLARVPSGERMITEIAEVIVGKPGNGGVSGRSGPDLRLKPLFVRGNAQDGYQLIATGRLPSFASELVQAGHLDAELFFKDICPSLRTKTSEAA